MRARSAQRCGLLVLVNALCRRVPGCSDMVARQECAKREEEERARQDNIKSYEENLKKEYEKAVCV